ncbi:alpha/beta hydrolase [Sphingobacterium sp. IITKGP-BTPF85]|uniref:alpha/beta hydrolase n=1 Tax=Sphingobacterium sp. IITKGP-BTPF85 TaxID=1338009 RepID=UPI000415B654|nr:alpha/beta hydrolase-fold protein [Sphingobacterium sp. IITKGP-BTPF85]KKX48395.1 enterochelin esterase [Sphingobacterium sp. IITKGP-BTPF85]
MKNIWTVLCIVLSITVLKAQTVTAPEGFAVYQPDIIHGKIDTITYPSSTVGIERTALVYLPPGFSAKELYPVLYLLHGIGGDQFEWLNNGTPHVILDNLYAQGKLEPMIVVLPNGRAMKDDRAIGNIMDAAKVEAFATFQRDLIDDLIPYVEKTYPVNANPLNRALFGLSMGGGQALNFGLGNLDTFAWVGGFSSAPNTLMPEQLIPHPQEVKDKLKLLWLSCGDQDGLITITNRTHDYLKKHEVPHVFYIEPGGHDLRFGRMICIRFRNCCLRSVVRVNDHILNMYVGYLVPETGL